MERNQSTQKLHIQMFAHFAVSGMGGHMDEESIRSEMLTKLLAYILCHKEKELSVQELVEVLWNNEESDNPAGALKNLVYRLRTMMKKEWNGIEFIRTGRGSYKWNEEIQTETDIDEFERYCSFAARTEDREEKLDAWMKACGLYKGGFLPKLAGESWTASLATYYHSKYLNAVKSAALLLEEKERYEEIAQICSMALRVDSLDESIHCYFIRALARQGKYKLALEQYKKAAASLYENLGVTPSRELRNEYEELLKQTHEKTKSISVVQEELNEDTLTGAFLCEYGVFKKTYQLEKRRSGRLGISVYLSLITVEPLLDVSADSQAYINMINEGMERLEKVLLTCLRAGDVISKYSASQYIVLLPTCQYETAKMVMKRIQNAFAESSKKNREYA